MLVGWLFGCSVVRFGFGAVVLVFWRHVEENRKRQQNNYSKKKAKKKSKISETDYCVKTT